MLKRVFPMVAFYKRAPQSCVLLCFFYLRDLFQVLFGTCSFVGCLHCTLPQSSTAIRFLKYSKYSKWIIIYISVFYDIASIFIHIQETRKDKTEENHFISANAFKFNRLMLLYEVLFLMIADCILVFLFFF